MKKLLVIVMMAACISLLSLAARPKPAPIGVEHTIAYFKYYATEFAQSVAALEKTVQEINPRDSITILAARESLKQCRFRFKQIEFFINYFFRSLTIIYNSPNVIEVEEPFLEYREPTGLQVIGGLLFPGAHPIEKERLVQEVALLHESARDINSLLYNLPIDDQQILESIRLELINMMSLGIAGFDAPELKTGIEEAAYTLQAFTEVLTPYLDNKNKSADSVRFYLQAALQLTRENNDFNDFDRAGFLTKAALPLQKHLHQFIKSSGLDLNTTQTLDYNKEQLFNPGFVRIGEQGDPASPLALLGKDLFFEKALSGNNKRSCASCHLPEKFFADGMIKNNELDGHALLQRNTPTLLYASYQYAQFWDGRVKTMEEQVREVLQNPVEMRGNADSIRERLQEKPAYAERFTQIFPGNNVANSFSIDNVSAAIAAYLRTLAPFNSSFDNYMRGDKDALNAQQKKGFNLFMGKGLCGTCHVMPLFNGLTAPLYDRTTMEVVGTTSHVDFSKPQLDEDSGRYKTYPIDYYLRAFKTPGLRNIAQTAPYMHNGAFPTLQSVVEFYNKGGGAGLGLNVPHQTLSSSALNLTEDEVAAIVSFLESLTDDITAYSKDKKVYKLKR